MSAKILSTATAIAVASEVLDESVSSAGYCRNCGEPSGKTIFADGDSETCLHCGAKNWYELRDGEVHSHAANPRAQGMSLSEVLAQRARRRVP